MEEKKMADDWLRANARVQASYPEDWVREFGFDLDDTEVNEMRTEYGHWTFPKDKRWRDQEDTVWRRAGAYVFDYKQPSKLPEPEGIRFLKKQGNGIHVTLECQVERAFRASSEVIGDSIYAGQSDAVTSKNCGRAVLLLRRMTIRGTKLTRRKKKEEEEEEEE